MRRRSLLVSGAGGLLGLAGCSRQTLEGIEGGFAGIAQERGHLLREPWQERAPDITRRTHTVIAGGGIAGLAAARALRLAGQDDFALLELEDTAGGNSRGMAVDGIACPMGAHYLPVPGDDARHVQDLLEELGLRRRVAGRWQYDELHLCHSPQERLFFHGHWQDGLLPVEGVGPATLAQYRRFAALVAEARRQAHYTVPITNQPLAQVQLAQDAMLFSAWLGQQGLTDPQLRWYLDYCCRDDYGAGTARVSAWAGIHYFASRHGFHAPGEAPQPGDEEAGLLTWPEGNGWLSRQLAAPLGERLLAGRVVRRIVSTRDGVELDAWDIGRQRLERWQARRCVVALPLFIAARVLPGADSRWREQALQAPHAAWLVANLRLKTALEDRPGAAPSWDNVLYGSPGLGYVDALHQSLRPVPGETVLSYYRALGPTAAARQDLLARPWTHWRDTLLAELAAPHPDLAEKTTRIDIVRYGHAMRVPVPGTLSQIAAWPNADRRNQLSISKLSGLLAVPGEPRMFYAHADASGYSVFEEAFTRGHLAGLAAAGREPG